MKIETQNKEPANVQFIQNFHDKAKNKKNGIPKESSTHVARNSSSCFCWPTN